MVASTSSHAGTSIISPEGLMEQMLTTSRALLVQQITTYVRDAFEHNRVTVVAVAGESGYGKSIVLEHCQAALSTHARAVLVECPSPIGVQSEPLVQPLYPFVKAIEQVLTDPQQKAKRRLVMNIGLSVLGMIPLVGSIFDVTKEVMRDMREYRRESEKRESSQTDQIARALKEIASDMPMVILIDDAQWLDAASIHVLEQLVHGHVRAPLVFILAYEQSHVQAQNRALDGYIASLGDDTLLKVELPLMTRSEIQQVAQRYLAHYHPNTLFDDWLLEQTGGVPALILSYLQYFAQHPPFDPDGSLKRDVLQTNYRPASLFALVEDTLAGLDDESKLMLALCAAEGMMCTVFIVAKLLESDPVTTVRRLRALAQRSGAIRSLGMRRLYGVETTAYSFTHAGYYRYFVEYLEHEERVEVHARIAAVLEERMRASADEALSEQLAPIVAAHFLEAGNDAAARQVYQHLYHMALDAGHPLVAEYARHAAGVTEQFDASLDGEKDFYNVLSTIVEYWYAGHLLEARRAADQLLHDGAGSPEEKLLGELVRIRIMLDLGEATDARNRLARLSIEDASNDQHEFQCLIAAMNTIADTLEGNTTHAWDHAVTSAVHARAASLHARCLALANIGLILDHYDRMRSRIALRGAEQLSIALGFGALATQLRQAQLRQC